MKDRNDRDSILLWDGKTESCFPFCFVCWVVVNPMTKFYLIYMPLISRKKYLFTNHIGG